ncbi:MAG: hypothetical protein IT562_11660 [Alphaproteobacteria bacterium]|nr:hypothetical protein [Alphaproteobacteria bacterium]
MSERRKSAWMAAALAGLALFLAVPAVAQTPLPTMAYIVGRAEGIDLAGNSEIAGPDGRADGWVRILVRAIGYDLAQAQGKLPEPGGAGNTLGPVSGGRSLTGGISGFYVKSMTLRHKTIPGLRWDTISGNNVPLLVVIDGSTVANSPTGSIAGLNLSRERTIDLYMADPGQIGWRVAGFVLDIDTLDGKLTIDVQPYNIFEANYRY